MTETDWELLARYAAGDCTPEERAQVERWRDAQPAHQAQLDAIREYAAHARHRVTAERRAELLQALRRRTAQEERSFARPPIAPLLRTAAAVLLLAGGSAAGFLVLRQSNAGDTARPAAERVVAAAYGQRLAVRLPDGTQAVLAPGTTLRIGAAYGSRARTVRLDGEAAFTVIHDEARPFTVETPRTIVRDLGTRFVLRAYAEELAVNVAVAEGVVEVIENSNVSTGVKKDVGGGVRSDAVTLHPGDVAHLRPTGGLAVDRNVDIHQYFAWTEGRLVFRGASLGAVVAQLRRWYDVRLQLASPELGALRLTATFRDESAAEALNVIATAHNLAIVESGGTYTLRAK